MPAPGLPRRGSALIMAVIIVAVLALVATAFIATARLESRAATNALRGVQAGLACRSGLAAALYRIARTAELYSDLADGAKWHGHFHPAAGETSEDLCPDTWVAHYDHATLKWEMRGKRWPMPRVSATVPEDIMRELRRARGFTAEYYVAVADLDGKLHCNPKYFANLLDDNQTGNMVEALGVPAAVRDALKWDNTVLWSLGQLRSRLPVGFADDPGTTENELNLAEKFFTVYPRVPSLAAKGDAGLPPVNVNTARPEVLRAIIINVPNLGPKVSNVVSRLTAARPFADRKEMEAALDDLAPAPVGDDTLTEQQFNDLLNSLAGTIAEAESDYDKPGFPGVYEYDFNPPPAGSPPAPTGGDRTTAAPATGTAADSWGTEVKFASRFYHIYVLGRTVAENDGRTLAERRLHAVYDAELRRVLWSRWHFHPKANAAD